MDAIAISVAVFLLCIWPLIGVLIGVMITKYRIKFEKRREEEF